MARGGNQITDGGGVNVARRDTDAAEPAPSADPLEGCKMKTPEQTEIHPSALDSRNSKPKRFSPRQTRTLEAFLAKPLAWISRTSIDTISGSANGPQIIHELRRKIGDDGIDTKRVHAIDRDGRPCRPGFFRLSDKGRERILSMGFGHE